jgi:hypothetical protein
MKKIGSNRVQMQENWYLLLYLLDLNFLNGRHKVGRRCCSLFPAFLFLRPDEGVEENRDRMCLQSIFLTDLPLLSLLSFFEFFFRLNSFSGERADNVLNVIERQTRDNE